MDHNGKPYKGIVALLLALFLVSCGKQQGNDGIGYPSYFTDKQSYEQYFANQSDQPSSGNVRAFILPHHLAVSHDLARAYLSAKGTKPLKGNALQWDAKKGWRAMRQRRECSDWWAMMDLNHRPPHYQCGALTTELIALSKAGRGYGDF